MVKCGLISRILIANRGEIALRIIRTCKSLGIESVVVFSDVDRHMPFVTEADYAIPIGDPMEYLSIATIVKASRDSESDAVHPGYGFLSENPSFPAALAEAGIAFIGPSVENIRNLGNKITAKQLATSAGVPTAPTLLLSDADPQRLQDSLDRFASSVGYPLLIKSAAGGGGRGMRILEQSSDMQSAIISAMRESEASFGDGTIFIEKFVSSARHIEVQIAGDHTGRIVALGTRDCTVQRNNQKIIEEAPATNLKPGVEEALCAAAVRLAQEAGYTNLGTVEFLYTPEGIFYFLEVNTRLQVEHPVTEMVTGVDLVALQIHLTGGKTLQEFGLHDQIISTRGHAIEARLCAETYDGMFHPTTGTIIELSLPTTPRRDSSSVRNDFGYSQCCIISHHYDSLVGKIIVHGTDRLSAIEEMENSLAGFQLSGVATNKTLLHSIVTNPLFLGQDHSVRRSSELFPEDRDIRSLRFLAHAIYATSRFTGSSGRPTAARTWYLNSPWSGNNQHTLASYPVANLVDGVLHEASVGIGQQGAFHIAQITPEPDEASLHLKPISSAGPSRQYLITLLDSHLQLPISIVEDGQDSWVHLPQGSVLITKARNRHETSGFQDDSGGMVKVLSPLPATVLSIPTTLDANVSEGDVLMVLDSMKMEHPIRSPQSGVVSSIEVVTGSIVTANQLLVTIS